MPLPGTTLTRTLLAALALASLMVAIALTATEADAKMRTERLGKNLCLTTGGGKFVKIPGFPGERVDRRLLKDIRFLRRKYKIFVTDGYSHDGVHSLNGEHPLGLALDIAPDFSRGGSWRLITRLAKRAEPEQNRPVAPFRWVGYNGDAGHGRGNHLHLSWNHTESRPFHPARSVYTLRCPGRKARKGGGKDKDGKRKHRNKRDDGPSGGVTAGGGGTGGTRSGGVSPLSARAGLDLGLGLDKPVVETGGVGLR